MCACCMIYILYLFDPSRALAFTPLLGAAALQYLVVSFASAFVSEGMESIGNSLYGSKWYLLDVNRRKDFLKVLMLGQKIKTYTVGPFGFSNLERFRQVSC